MRLDRLRRLLSSKVRALIVAAAIGALLLGIVGHARAAATDPGVLIIHSNQRAQPATVIIGNILGNVVTDALQRPVNFFEEYLDIEWASTEAYAAAQAEFLRQKYSGRNIRVIVADAPPALRFTLKFRDRMLPDVPVVHVSIPIDQLEGIPLPADFVGKPIDLDPTETLRFALRLQPRAERIVIVIGAAPRDHSWDQRLRKAVAQLEVRPEIEYLAGLPTTAVLQRLGALSKDTIVFTPGYYLDGAGHVSTPRQVAELIASASAAPVYGPFDTFIGTGIVGGYIVPFGDQATQAGAIVARLLTGTPPTAIARSSFVNVPVVDWRALRRWNMDENLLPAETLVRFREPSVWERHGREISIGIAVLVLQTALIAALLIQRRRRRLAEQQVQVQRNELAHVSRLATAGELTASIAHEINQPLGAILSNVDAADLVLQSGEDRRDLLHQILADIRRDDLRASEVIRRLRALLAKQAVEHGSLEVNAVLSEVITLLRSEASRRNVNIETPPGPIAIVVGDRVQMQQVMINLLLNAMDAVGDSGEDRRTITVSIETDEHHVLINVRDRGHGITPEEMPRLFDSFYSTKHAGMGLGLSIARTIVDAHGGRIWAEGRPGDGAEFHVEFPLREALTPRVGAGG
jgi:signal transduction histidine kinase